MPAHRNAQFQTEMVQLYMLLLGIHWSAKIIYKLGPTALAIDLKEEHLYTLKDSQKYEVKKKASEKGGNKDYTES